MDKEPAISTHNVAQLILLLAGLTAIAPLAIDAYLPAMPLMAAEFAVSIHDIELSLSLFLAGFAVGQLTGGPLSDHFGRRRVIFIGLTLFCVASMGIVLSHTLLGLWIWRVVQAIGGGMAIVNSSAVIRDISSGRDSARYLSHMAIIMMIAPLVAPLIGMVCLHLAGWHSIFIVLFVYALLIGLLLYRLLPETRVKAIQTTSALKRYIEVLSHRKALAYLAAQSFTYGGLFSFITASPSVYMIYFGVSASVYPLLFAVNVLMMIVVNRINVRLLHFYDPPCLLKLGQILQVITGLTMLLYILISPAPALAIIVIGIMIFIGSQALIVSNAIASTVEFFPRSSATATAVLGSFGFLSGAASGLLVSSLGDGSLWPMITVMSGCAIAGLTLKTLILHSCQEHPQNKTDC
ncbi:MULTISPECIES: multidrug effflux MFS transporter [unclassified Methylophaga]|jgi:DHA1 family bicyclomycin/chloramphenicol resistance-like MFS transporter|uniref:multidrug effflux MFS transporter n=1 Tax=unclassified Methylophaga TaxID=2629249 RepID=UPI000C8DAA8C|nr:MULTISPECIES: multidrug effflux MFS transporter [unclassified Methylophaga]MAK67212.1 multidrug transporter [Methylophaga sp.]MAY18250.1 multidrug transporter [Methylophaga sp.]MBN47563.1 multidrug transporter [Methylophaga sp.]HCD04667.1 multidrug transporter [Methylophaga sp.]|tara:strand:+ start:4033 stop:5253 length:1221 start_codon:yes stop_codon:yes gene_type:complete